MAEKTTPPPATLLAESIGMPPVAPGFDAKYIAELGAKVAEPTSGIITLDPKIHVGLPPELPIVWDPRKGEFMAVKSYAEQFRLKPARKVGTAKALTLESFIALANRHKTEHTAVFADTSWHKPGFTAVIDYHDNTSGGPADNGKHRIQYDFPLSEEWKAWVKLDGEPMSQVDFAAFLEDHIQELCSPTEAEKNTLERDFVTTVATPAEVVQLSRGLQVHIASQVKNAHTLQTGAGQIQWQEEHQTADGKPLTVPGIFLLNIAPFFMGEPVRIPVRLRYRVSGKITWFYQIFRPDFFVTERCARRPRQGAAGNQPARL
ncbi:DUF2303 family protein [Xanthobacter flavus]|uniref:DUF2303 family protein n=1 Tax=Xanthobacter flavus TaxID=281 RepID=UPI001AE81ED3|nr:DUF2303 family protein [Xanthobacter flavus]MBP2147968.1 uncharacterized protein YfdQ (DUF2303 family) [Xanthobacter flavus]